MSRWLKVTDRAMSAATAALSDLNRGRADWRRADLIQFASLQAQIAQSAALIRIAEALEHRQEGTTP